MKAFDPLFSIAAFRDECARLPAPRMQSIVKGIANPMQAAILVPVVETADGLALIATRRHSGMRTHSDHWVFPGGRVDPDDRSSADAAIREASEELGVSESAFDLLGQLDSRGPIITGYIIDVFVALLDKNTELNPKSEEVAAVETILLADMCRPENAFRRLIALGDDTTPTVIELPPEWIKPVLHFVIRPGETLWGLQADILAELLQYLCGDQLTHLAT